MSAPRRLPIVSKLTMALIAISFVGCVEPRDTPLDAGGIGGRNGAGGVFGSNDAADTSSQDSAAEALGTDSRSEASDGRDSAAETSGADADAESNGDAHAAEAGQDAEAGKPDGGDARAGMSGQDAATETSHGVDASPESGSAGTGGKSCPYRANYGDVVIANNLMFTMEQMLAAGQGQPSTYVASWSGVVRNGSVPDQLSIDLISGRAPFDSMLHPADVDLSTQRDFQTCGTCVGFFVAFNSDASALLPEPQSFIATSGRLNVTAVPSFPATANSRITGLLSNVVFEHVTIDPVTNVATKVDDCQIIVTSAAFDAPVQNN